MRSLPGMPGVNIPIRSKLILAAAGAILLAATGCGPGSTKQPENQDQKLGDAVTTMYSQILEGDYAAAYTHRSARCSAAMTVQEYSSSMSDLMAGYTADPDSITYDVVARGPGTAWVTIDLSSTPGVPSSLTNDTPRLWSLVDAHWEFDNCE